MKLISWYLYGGAGGVTAAYQHSRIQAKVTEWCIAHNVDAKLTVTSEQGSRYAILKLDDAAATMFLISWDAGNPYYGKLTVEDCDS